jgi:hypothetical protein
MRSTGKLIAFGLAGCAAIVVTGCGSSTPSEPDAATLASSAQSSIRSANSVHVDGEASSSGLPVGVNLGINRAGDMNGTITENGATFDIISAAGKVYIKATPAFLKQAGAPASACNVVCGHWVEVPASEAKPLTSQITMSTLTGENNSSELSKLTKAGSTTVNGEPAWVLRASDGSTVDVSQQPAHYPLQVNSDATGSKGVVRYSQWNSVPTPKPPPANQVINLSGLK